MRIQDNKVGLFGLIAVVIGSMVGSGFFDLPGNMAQHSALGPILIAFLITFVGMMCLVCVFKDLSMRKPQLNAGIYAYAKAGFGNYMGFNSAWGYWISACIGSIAFVIMLSMTLSAFLPVLGDGTGFEALIFNSVLIWSITALCISGIKSASLINLITTIAKLFASIIFITFVLSAFDYRTMEQDIWGKNIGTTIFAQVKSPMLVTLWIFIGIEGACVFSRRAKKRADIGKATLIGFVVVFCVYIFASTLPFGLMTQKSLMLLKTPSTAGILEYIMGSPGKTFINIAIVISILGSLLSWILLAAEVPYVAAQEDRLFPRIFARVNSVGSPSGALYISAISQQIYLIIAYWHNSAYLKTLSFSTSMILVPYLFSAAYALLLSISGEGYEIESYEIRIKNIIINTIAVAYCIWLIYAAGINYLLLSSVLYGAGMVVYVVTRLMGGNRVFTVPEFIMAGMILGVILFTILH
jgi:arginine:ornithine antiporter/lysine permease